MRSVQLATTSAIVLATSGLMLLFVPDDLLPRLIEGFPASGTWLGQLAGAGCLAVANLNWMTRRTVIGGIFGRPIVATNTMLYFVSFSALVRAAGAAGWPLSLSLASGVTGLMAAAYGWLMFRGPQSTMDG